MTCPHVLRPAVREAPGVTWVVRDMAMWGISHTADGGAVKTGQVFVSRTSDLATFPPSRSFAQAAMDAVARAGLAPVDMRYFAARDGHPAEFCRQRVRECDIYVAV